jgi:Zn-dependent protease with chaperone function
MALKASVVIALAACAMPAQAGVCDVAWDGDSIVAGIAGSATISRVPLRDKSGKVSEVGADQIEAFAEAKTRIAKAAGIAPSFIICAGEQPNAFAAPGPKGDLIGVTVGMLKMVDGDRDMAAAVIGHEVAHHTKQHLAAAQQREQLTGLAILVVGAVLSAKTQRQMRAPPRMGFDLAQIGSTLVSRKFDRDQEREADDTGFAYVVDAGFNPVGALRVAERFGQLGSDRAGLFFDTHPGWAERQERFRILIAESPKAQELVARGDTPRNAARAEAREALAAAVLEPAYATSDAQKSYVDGIAALKAKDPALAVRELRASAAAGYAPAQGIVGVFHANGRLGFAKDDVEAVRLYRLAAEQDHAASQNNLGVMHANGRGGLAKDDAEALRLYHLAAEQGFAMAQSNIGFMHEQGRGGLAKDDQEAVRWYGLAAEQGNAQGQFLLARMYESGRGGLGVDIDAAVTLYRKAASSRFVPAAVALKRLGRAQN